MHPLPRIYLVTFVCLSLGISARFHHFSLLLYFPLSCPLDFFLLPGVVWVGWMGGSDSICFQPFFLFKSTKKKWKTKLCFLPKIQSPPILLFLLLSNRERHGCSDKNSLAISLSFSFHSFSSFFSWLYLFFLLFLCLNFPFFFNFQFKKKIFYLFLLLFLCSNFSPFFSILHFLFIISLSVVPSLSLFKFYIFFFQSVTHHLSRIKNTIKLPRRD